MKKLNLGDFITNKRIEKNMSSRSLAISCNISPAYMNDIEKNKRVPTFKILKSIGKNLKLNESEVYKLMDLAVENRVNLVPYDMVEYIKTNENLKRCIREKIKRNELTGWEKALDSKENKEDVK